MVYSNGLHTNVKQALLDIAKGNPELFSIGNAWVVLDALYGRLFNSIKSGKKIIAMARLYEYNEMADNHQLELLGKLVEGGYVLDGTYSLEEAWNKLDSFTPRPNDFENHIVESIDGWIWEWMDTFEIVKRKFT